MPFDRRTEKHPQERLRQLLRSRSFKEQIHAPESGYDSLYGILQQKKARPDVLNRICSFFHHIIASTYTPVFPNIAMKNGPGWKMYFLLNFGNIPASYVRNYQRVREHESIKLALRISVPHIYPAPGTNKSTTKLAR